MAEQNVTSAVAFKVKAKGEEIDEAKLHSWTVEQDLSQPDMCVVTVRNDNNEFTDQIAPGDEVEITVGADDTAVFKGECVAIECQYKAGGESLLMIRAFNKMHRLCRGPKSRTFVDMKDSDIVSQIAGEVGLSADAGDTPVTHEHVYQHNQTDLEFLRVRAARNGFELIVEDRQLSFKKPDNSADSGISLVLHEQEESSSGALMLKSFSPRLSSAQVVKEVEVRAWDPEKKEEIVAKATAQSSPLGSTTGASATESAFGATVSFTVDHPVASQEEAQKLAEARLDELTMGYITGDGVCRGSGDLKPGIVVKITVNRDTANDRFNGKYLLSGCTHRYKHTTGGETGGYTTMIRVSRDGEKG